MPKALLSRGKNKRLPKLRGTLEVLGIVEGIISRLKLFSFCLFLVLLLISACKVIIIFTLPRIFATNTD